MATGPLEPSIVRHDCRSGPWLPSLRGGRRRPGRWDAGACSLEQALLTCLVCAAAVGLAVVLVSVMQRYNAHTTVATTPPAGDVARATAAGCAVILVTVLLILAAGKVVAGRRRRRDAVRLAPVRARVGADLARWLRYPPGSTAGRFDLDRWLEWEQAGLTPPIAEAWWARGYHPDTAAAAVRVDAGLDEVDRLVDLLREFDPTLDRFQQHYLFGWRGESVALGDWLANPPDRVRRVVADQIAHRDPSGIVGGPLTTRCLDAVLERLRQPPTGSHPAWSGRQGPQDAPVPVVAKPASP